jgi:hypothetical protein
MEPMKPTILYYDKTQTAASNGFRLTTFLWYCSKKYKLEGVCFDLATEEGATKPVFFPGWVDEAQSDAERIMNLAVANGTEVEIWENIEEYPGSVSCRLVKVEGGRQVCSECNWTNVGLINLGDPLKPRWVCQGCCKRAIEKTSPAPCPDTAMLIRRLCRVIAKHDPNNTVREQALDYLHRHDLGGSPLKAQ